MTTKYMQGDYEAIHEHPVWKERANFIIAADIAEEENKREWEQLWARQIRDFRFEICCIPFFVYDISLGDEVETDENYVIRRVLKASGHSTFRVWFGEASKEEVREKIIQKIQQSGCEHEWSSENLLAISAPTIELFEDVLDFLCEQQKLGHLMYETGRKKIGKEG